MNTHTWERISNENPTYVLTVDGSRVAAVWFQGGHVERPDTWHVTFRKGRENYGGTGFETLQDAKRSAEEEFGIMPTKDEIVMYLVARKDLKMSPGKLGAQVGHAVHYLLMRGTPVPHDERDWLVQWLASPSHAKIVLSVNSEEELVKLHHKLGPERSVLVIDEGRTEIASKTKTALGVYPMPKSFAKQFVGHLSSY